MKTDDVNLLSQNLNDVRKQYTFHIKFETLKSAQEDDYEEYNLVGYDALQSGGCYKLQSNFSASHHRGEYPLQYSVKRWEGN
jgi:hypothetical protein